MTSFAVLRPYLPSAWTAALEALPAAVGDTVQEVRLRAGRAVTLSTPSGERYLSPHGLSAAVLPASFVCTPAQVERCFLRFCEDAVYAHQGELQQGYIAVVGGIRVGVAGTAVMDGGQVQGVRDVTSLCIRLPRHMAGCAAPLRHLMLADGYPRNTLLVGPPSSGKTTLLRDLAAGLAAAGYRVTVVDERGELSGPACLGGCDVLVGYPKAAGIRQAVRCLAPDVIVFDELGREEEAAAVASCARAGVAVATSLHGCSPADLAGQSLPRLLVRRRTFDRWVFLAGRERVGQIALCCRAERGTDGVDWLSVDTDGGCGRGSVRGPTSDPTSPIHSGCGAAVGGAGAADDRYRPAYDAAVAAAGGVGRLR